MAPRCRAVKLREPSESGRAAQYFHPMCFSSRSGAPARGWNTRPRKSASAVASRWVVGRKLKFEALRSVTIDTHFTRAPATAMQRALRVGERPIYNTRYAAANAADRDRSPRTDAEKDDFNCLQEHHEIEGEAMVLHVIQVVFKFFLGLHLRRTVAVAHLGPPGDARLHEVAFRVIRNRLRQFLDEGRTLGARADEAHLPGEDVEHLR